MIRKYLMFVVFILVFLNHNNAQAVKWAQKAGGINSDFARFIATDNNSNTFVIGGYSGSIVFPGTGNLTSRTMTSFGQIDIYVAKFDCNKNLVWKNGIGSVGNECGSFFYLSIKYDNKSSLYVTGAFAGTATFTTTSGSPTSLISNGSNDAFIAKYDTSGILQWVVKCGGIDSDEGFDLSIDNNGNIITGGYFSSTASFGTTSGSSISKISIGNEDIFIAKYSQYGVVQWVNRAGGAGIDVACSIALDNLNNIYVGGNFGFNGSSASFGSFLINNSGGWGGYIAKANSSGNWLWVNGMGGPQTEAIGRCAVDELGNVYVTGHFTTSNTTFSSSSPGSSMLLINIGNYDVNMASLDSNGVLRWVKSIGGVGVEYGWHVSIDKNNNIISSGYFSNTVNFGNSFNLTSSGMGDGFICTIDPSNGNTIGVLKLGGTGDDHCYATIIDKTGNKFACGSFSNTGSFGTQSLISSGSDDAYFIKIAPAAPFKLKPVNISLCNGDSAILRPLDSLSGLSFQWYRNNAVVVGANQFYYVAKLSGTYYLKVTNSCNEQDTSELITIIYNSTNISAGIDTTICQGDSLQLLATGASTYFWSPNNGLSNVNISNPYAKPTITTDYIVRGINSSCIGYDTVRVNIIQVLANAGIDTTICYGDSIKLSASALGNYVWQGSATLYDTMALNSFVKPIVATNYILKSTNLTCLKRDTVKVFVNNPLAIAGVNRTICLGDSIQLNGTGSGALRWSPNYFLTDSNQAQTYTKPILSKTYILYASIGRCINKDSMQVLVNQVAAQLGADTLICKGDSVLLVGNALGNFAWQTNIAIRDTSLLSVYVKPNISTNFILQATNGTCLKTDTIKVNVSSPISNADSDQNICLGDSIQLNGIGYSTLSWYPGLGLKDSTLANTYAKPIISTNYILLAKDGKCFARDTVKINVNQVLSNAGIDKGICPGDSVQLNASAIGIYYWNASPTISNAFVLNPYAKPVTSTNYVLTSTAGTCIKTDTVLVTVSLPLSLNAGLDKSICLGDSIQLNASGGFNYSWNYNLFLNDSTINNPYVKPNITSKFIVKSGLNNCKYFDTVTITVNTLPNIDAGLNKSICKGDSIQLQGVGLGAINWFPNTFINDTAILNPFVKPINTTKYYLTIKDVYCKNIDSVVIAVNNSIPIDAGIDLSICNGDTIQLNVLATNQVRWLTSNFLSDTTSLTPKAYPNITTDFIVKSINVSCPYIDTIKVIVNDIPIVNAGRDTIVCKGFPYQLNGQALLADKYSWTPNTNLNNANILNPTMQIPQTGMYILKAENTLGNCAAKDSLYILVDSVIAQFTTDITNGFAPLIVNFNNTSINANKYLWELDSVTKSTNVSPTHTYTNNGDYSVILHATNNNGCEDTSMVTIYVDGEIKFQLPNVFTPNGDSINDYFETKISNYKLLKQLRGTIWNRWGQQIYEFSIPNEQWWDGNYEGNPCSDGVYFYIIEAVTTNGKKYNFHGTVTLLR